MTTKNTLTSKVTDNGELVASITMTTKPMSKALEIEVIRRIADMMPTGSYLHGLFTDMFVDWVAGCIQKDIMPDAEGTIEAYNNRLLRAIDERRDADTRFEATKASYLKVVEERNTAYDRAAKLATEVGQLQEVIKTLRIERDMHAEAAANANDKIAAARRALDGIETMSAGVSALDRWGITD